MIHLLGKKKPAQVVKMEEGQEVEDEKVDEIIEGIAQEFIEAMHSASPARVAMVIRALIHEIQRQDMEQDESE